MSKYSEKVAARRIQAQIDLAVRITDGGKPAPAPKPKPKTPPPEQRDAAIAERDRLRDLVRRLSRHLANYITSESDNDLLREARAAIGEDAR